MWCKKCGRNYTLAYADHRLENDTEVPMEKMWVMVCKGCGDVQPASKCRLCKHQHIEVDDTGFEMIVCEEEKYDLDAFSCFVPAE